MRSMPGWCCPVTEARGQPGSRPRSPAPGGLAAASGQAGAGNVPRIDAALVRYLRAEGLNLSLSRSWILAGRSALTCCFVPAAGEICGLARVAGAAEPADRVAQTALESHSLPPYRGRHPPPHHAQCKRATATN